MSVTGQWFSKINATKTIWQKILPKSYVSKICDMVVLKFLPNLTSPSKTSTNPYNFHSGGTFSTEEMAWWSVLSDGSMHLCDSLQCYIRNFGLRNICQNLSNPQCHTYKRPRFFWWRFLKFQWCLRCEDIESMGLAVLNINHLVVAWFRTNMFHCMICWFTWFMVSA